MSAGRQSLAASAITALQPIGIATAQILALVAANVGEVAFSDAFPALAVAVVATLIAWLLAWGVCGGARRGAEDRKRKQCFREVR